MEALFSSHLLDLTLLILKAVGNKSIPEKMQQWNFLILELFTNLIQRERIQDLASALKHEQPKMNIGTTPSKAPQPLRHGNFGGVFVRG